MRDRLWLKIQDRRIPRRPADVRVRPHGAVLVIEERVPEPDRSAGGLFIWQLLQLLREAGQTVALFAHDRVARQPYVADLEALGVEVLGPDVDIYAWIRRDEERLGSVVIARPEMGRRYVGQMRRVTRARLTYYTHDLHFMREMRRYEVSGDAAALRESHRLEKVETRLLNAVDAAITPSPAEVALIERIAAHTPVFPVPPFVGAGTANHPQGPPMAERQALVMVGGYQHLPNVDAAIHLVRDVMPAVWRAVPQARVELVGSDPPPSVLALGSDRVLVRGHVPDLAEVYSRARMSVSPLRFGSGIKGKILTSLEAGVAVVTTSIGNEGIDLISGEEALIGDEPELLADCVIRLYRDAGLLERIASTGRTAALTRFSKERARSALMAALGDVSWAPVQAEPAAPAPGRPRSR